MSKFFAILTHVGADKIANATVLGTQIKITQMAVGDGNGTLPVPDPAQTKLVHEVRRGAINQLSIDEKNTNQIIAEQVIPENEGGWWIREIGLYDEVGTLIAVGNCPETYKPQLQEGSGRTQTLRMILVVSSTEAVTLKVDPSVVLATKSYVIELVDKKLKEHEQSRNHPSATLKEKGLVQLSSELNSMDETKAATPKALKAAYELASTANGKVDSLTQQVNAIVEIPIGGSIEWPTAAPVPENFLANEGRSYDQKSYPELVPIFPTLKMPDDRGYVKRGLDITGTVDPDGKTRKVGDAQGDAIRNLQGSISARSASSTGSRGVWGTGVFVGEAIEKWEADSVKTEVNKQYPSGFYFDASAVVPTAAENRMKNKATIWITRVK